MGCAGPAGARASKHDGSSFERGCSMSIFAEFLEFLGSRKKFWLIPLLALLVIFGGLLILSQGSAIAPFIYTLF